MKVLSRWVLWLWSAGVEAGKRLGDLWPRRKPRVIRAVRVEDFPDKLEQSMVYLAGEGPHLWAAAMICPCGCGEVIELNLLKQTRPCWSAQEHADGSVTLHPSVWRQKGCRSHFIVRQGQIVWC
ncbi:MAG TPA: DUF6527 family protein [Xanthobacteraceae bacterium]